MSWDAAKVQAAFNALAYQLLMVRDQLVPIRDSIPEPSDGECEGIVPWTLTYELGGAGIRPDSRGK